MNKLTFTTYAKENGGRVSLLFLLFLLAIYEFVTVGFPAFAINCCIPVIIVVVVGSFRRQMTTFWTLIVVNFLIMWHGKPDIPIPASIPNELLEILLLSLAIIEYPNLDDNSISSALLNMGTINLMVTRANRTWKDVDQKALKELQSRLKDQNTLFMYLTEASRYAVEEFVGQLPPYTKFNNFVYRMSQMGLTAIENNHAK